MLVCVDVLKLGAYPNHIHEKHFWGKRRPFFYQLAHSQKKKGKEKIFQMFICGRSHLAD